MLRRFISRTEFNEKRLFLIFSLVFGLVNIIASPPFQVPDEFNHVHRIMQIAEGGFFPVKQGAAAGGFVRSDVLEIMSHYNGLPKHPEKKIRPQVIWQDLHALPVTGVQRVFLDFNNTAIHIPVAYLPQVVAWKLVDFLSDNFLLKYYLIRLMMLGLYIWVGLFCLRELPMGRKSFFIFLTLPMSLFIHASFSADYFLNLVYLLLSVMLARYILNPGAGRREVYWIAGLALVAGFLKAAYAPLMFAFLALLRRPQRKKTNMQLFLISAILFIASASAAFWFTQKNYFKMLDFVDPIAQMHFITEHPLKFLGILAKSTVIKFPFIPIGLTTQMGWLDVFIPWYVALVSIGVFFYCAISENTGAGMQKRDRWIFATGAFLCMLSVHFFLYLSWNPVGADIVSGMQGRYMFPAVGFLLLAILGLVSLKQRFSVLLALHTGVLIYSEVFMFFRYYRLS